MKIFLRLKHWQLFIIICCVPYIFQFISVGVLFVSKNPMAMFDLIPFMMLFFIGGLMGWLYTLGINLNPLLPNGVTMNLTRFRVFMIIPASYMLMISIAMGIVPHIGTHTSEPPLGFIFGMVGVILPLHFFSMFCMFYTIWFVGKSLKSVEMQKPITFSDYAGEFFLLWFFPLGIWFIQPRINKLFDTDIELNSKSSDQ